MPIYLDAKKFELMLDKSDVADALREIGNNIKAKAKALILAGGSNGIGAAHQTSLPGNAPNSLTGELARKLKVKVNANRLSVVITDGTKYALSLESGAKGGGRNKNGSTRRMRANINGNPTTKRILLPRPYLSTALEQCESEIEATIVQSCKVNIK